MTPEFNGGAEFPVENKPFDAPISRKWLEQAQIRRSDNDQNMRFGGRCNDAEIGYAECLEDKAQELASLERQLHEKTQQLAEAVKDKERLDFIENNSPGFDLDGDIYRFIWADDETDHQVSTGDTLREAIDAAILAKHGGAKG